MNKQDNPTVVISGGSRGLGQAIAAECLARGYRVATYSRSPSDFTRAMSAEDQRRERFLWGAVDAENPAEMNAFVSQVSDTFGRVDCLVNNAGIGTEGILTTQSNAVVDRCIDVNLRAAVKLTQACAKFMLRQNGGSIINISSVNAVRGHSGVAVYSATKAALDGLTRSLARELGAKNIRVNSVAPGYFESDMVADLSEAARARIIRRTPLARLGSAKDMANAVLFLMSADAAFITGQTIVVDGGITC